MPKAKAATGTSIVNIEAELAKQAEEISKKISAPGGDWIRCSQDKQFVMPDGTKNPGPLSVVIVEFVSGNFFYDRPFKRGEESPPACFALGVNSQGLVPSDTSPVKQAKDCDSCVNNQFGSNGAGKACQNSRILAVTVPTADEEAPIYLLKVSPTGITPFDAYVGSIKAQFNASPIKVVTEIYFDPNLTYGSLRFGNPTPNKNLAVHFGRQAAARARLLTAPDVSQYTPPVKAKGKK